jgi:polar amino acid transport system substrate-binding protein
MLLCRLLFLIAALSSAKVHAEELRVLVLNGDAMPWADIQENRLYAGLYFDLGQALAKQLRRNARFVLLPRKRLAQAMESGQADILCNYLPDWLPGDFDWSTAFIPNAELLITDKRVNKPASLKALSGVRIGTVLGYVYGELDRALGADFVRDDAPSMHHNLLKMSAGRMQHLVINQFELEYQQREGGFNTALHPAMVLRQFKGQCAVSRLGRVGVAQLNQAIASLQAQQELRKMLARYR